MYNVQPKVQMLKGSLKVQMLKGSLIVAPADNTRDPQTSFGPLGHIRLEAEALARGKPRGPADQSETSAWCLFQSTGGEGGEEVGVGRNQRVETYCSNLKRS